MAQLRLWRKTIAIPKLRCLYFIGHYHCFRSPDHRALPRHPGPTGSHHSHVSASRSHLLLNYKVTLTADSQGHTYCLITRSHLLLRHFLSFPVQRPYSAMGCRCPALLRGGRRCPRRVRRVGLHCRQHGGKPAHRPRTGAANARGWVCAVRGCGQRVQRKGLLCRSRHSGRTPEIGRAHV